jgi:hypothetical protein
MDLHVARVLCAERVLYEDEWKDVKITAFIAPHLPLAHQDCPSSSDLLGDLVVEPIRRGGRVKADNQKNPEE